MYLIASRLIDDATVELSVDGLGLPTTLALLDSHPTVFRFKVVHSGGIIPSNHDSVSRYNKICTELFAD